MATIIQRSFASGEVSPALYARVDQARYATGLRQCRNTIVLRTGGTSIRPGTQFIAECSNSSAPSRLLPFISSAAQAFVVEVGQAGKLRFYKNGAQVLNTFMPINRISNSSPATVQINGPTYGLANGGEVQINNVSGMSSVNGRNFKIQNLTATTDSSGNQTTTFQLYYFTGNPFDSTLLGSASGGTIQAVYEISHPYQPADLTRLQFVQSADVMTITARGYQVMQLKHFSDLVWTLSAYAYGPNTQSPTNPSVTAGGSGLAAQTWNFAVTSVNSNSEESLPLTFSATFGAPNAAYPWQLKWTPPANFTNVISYNVYASLNGIMGLVGIASATPFLFTGFDGGAPQVSTTPPVLNTPGDTYGAIGYYQQRFILGSGVNGPATTIASRTGLFNNFTNATQILDNNALNFTLIGRLVQEVRAYLDLGSLIILTDQGEYTAEGNQAGSITPTALNLRQTSFIGSSTLYPLVIGNSAIFVQARGSAVFDLGYDNQVRGFSGNELSIFANHLVDNYTIQAWAYQKRPHSVVWMVRSDGVLLSMTYIASESIVAWGRHDTVGTFEDVVSIPEGTTNAVYVIANRTVRGVTKRYIERLSTNLDGDQLNAVFSDATLSYNGTNTTGYTMTVSGGVNWTYDEVLTLTTNLTQVAFFSATDVGNGVQITGPDGVVTRFNIVGYINSTQVQVQATKTVPVNIQNVALTTWAKALKTVTGLYHLQNLPVSVVGDGAVVSSPNNADVQTLTVTNGTLVLDQPYVNIHVGLPYIADLETLDIDTTQGEPLGSKQILINQVNIHTQNTRGLWVGAQPPANDAVDPLANLTEIKPRSTETMNQLPTLQTGVIETLIQGAYTRGGRVFIRQVDPVPTSVLAVSPSGVIPANER